MIDDDPLFDARNKGDQLLRTLLQEIGSLSATEAATALRITEKEVEQRRADNRLIGIRAPSGAVYTYPAFQFQGGSTLLHLEEVLEALKEHDPLTQMGFFVRSSGNLGDETPLDVLRQGRVRDVLCAAECYVEQGSA